MRVLALLCTTLCSSAAMATQDGEWLDAEALTQMVSGHTAVCQHVSRPSSGRTYFAPDGTMHGIRRDEPRSGHWYVEGNTLCTDWGRRPICSRYRSDGMDGHYKYTLRGKQTVHIFEWLTGDQVYANVDNPAALAGK